MSKEWTEDEKRRAKRNAGFMPSDIQYHITHTFGEDSGLASRIEYNKTNVSIYKDDWELEEDQRTRSYQWRRNWNSNRPILVITIPFRVEIIKP